MVSLDCFCAALFFKFDFDQPWAYKSTKTLMYEERQQSLENVPNMADPKACDTTSAQMNLSDSGLITLGKRLAAKKSVTAKNPSKRAKRESDENLVQPQMMMSTTQHDTLNQFTDDKLDEIHRSFQDNLLKMAGLETINKNEATETEKSDFFERELEEGEDDEDSEKRRERRYVLWIFTCRADVGVCSS